MLRINILIIAYKQEELIKRALNSILCQREFGINKIIVCDDCSPDKTWDTLVAYKDSYPEIIEIYRNEKNLGIYGNKNRVLSLRNEADIYYSMAGDDALSEGILNQVQEMVRKNDIKGTDVTAIYFDWKHVKPNGVETVISNKAVLKHKDVFGLKLRNRISNRSCFVTKGLMDKYKQIDLSMGLSMAETLSDMQYSILAEKNYYMSYVGSLYFAGIGVSKNLFTQEYYMKSVEANMRMEDLFHLTGRDKYWNLYSIYLNRLGGSPSFKYAYKALWFYVIGVKYGPVKKILSEMVDYVLLLKKLL